MSYPPPPTVGRIVHYVSRGSADGIFPAVCRAAIVTEVGRQSDGPAQKVSLSVHNPTGLFFDRDVARSDDNEPGTWHWPEPVILDEEPPE